jgi:hypothetical protein
MKQKRKVKVRENINKQNNKVNKNKVEKIEPKVFLNIKNIVGIISVVAMSLVSGFEYNAYKEREKQEAVQEAVKAEKKRQLGDILIKILVEKKTVIEEKEKILGNSYIIAHLVAELPYYMERDDEFKELDSLTFEILKFLETSKQMLNDYESKIIKVVDSDIESDYDMVLALKLKERIDDSLWNSNFLVLFQAYIELDKKFKDKLVDDSNTRSQISSGVENVQFDL